MTRTARAGRPPRDGPRALAEPLAAWRASTLIGAGFDDELATELSQCDSMDFHELLTLVDRGCPARLAARILSPGHESDD